MDIRDHVGIQLHIAVVYDGLAAWVCSGRGI